MPEYKTEALRVDVGERTVYLRFKTEKAILPGAGRVDTKKFVEEEATRLEALRLLRQDEKASAADLARATDACFIIPVVENYLTRPAASSVYDIFDDGDSAMPERKLTSVIRSERKLAKENEELKARLAELEQGNSDK